MSAHNLAVVLVPTLFQTMNPDLLRLTREFIIHHTLLFLVNITPVTSDVLQEISLTESDIWPIRFIDFRPIGLHHSDLFS